LDAGDFLEGALFLDYGKQLFETRIVHRGSTLARLRNF
jgi:hypothetical protein